MSTLITAKDLSKSYADKLALNAINFEIQKGAPVALVGPNGAGKTTLFSLLCGYISPTKGSLDILGHKPGSAELFKQVSALPQDAQLDPRFNIDQQLAFYAKLQGYSTKQSQNEALRVLELVGLADVAKHRAGDLSHGMRKRVTIAQALIGEPKIVMLDEATAGLDPIHAREVRELVSELSSQATFILSSHWLLFAEDCAAVAVTGAPGRIFCSPSTINWSPSAKPSLTNQFAPKVRSSSLITVKLELDVEVMIIT